MIVGAVLTMQRSVLNGADGKFLVTLTRQQQRDRSTGCLDKAIQAGRLETVTALTGELRGTTALKNCGGTLVHPPTHAGVNQSNHNVSVLASAVRDTLV